MKISACWIAKNEESKIAASIESVRQIADEIILVDTGSTDGTVDVAKALGARVEHFEWINDFAAARNHALSFATGDIIIFLDADEWFEPALNSNDREMITNIFSKNVKVSALSFNLINLKNNDKLNSKTVVTRMFLNDCKYVGDVHEHLLTPQGKTAMKIDNGIAIKHSGYVEDVVIGKIRRNIELLQAGLSKTEVGSFKRIWLLLYLTRESFGLNDYNTACGYLLEALEHPSVMKKVCEKYSEEYITTIYASILLVFKRRNLFSRVDIYNKLIGLVKKVYINYSGTAEIDILYQYLFDYKEDKYLSEFDAAIKTAEAKKSIVSAYKTYENELYLTAMNAAWRRMNVNKTLEYAFSILQKGYRDSIRPLRILLSIIKHQKPEDILLFLSKIFDLGNYEDLKYLVKGAFNEGLQPIYSYYLKKLIDTGNYNTTDYIMLLLIYKKYDSAADMILSLERFGKDTVEKYMFYAALCSSSPEFAKNHAEHLTGYQHLLDAYFNKKQLESTPEDDIKQVQETYHVIAFVEGIESADRYLELFRGMNPELCYFTKAQYCESCAISYPMLDEDAGFISPLDFQKRKFIMQAYLDAKRFDEAISAITGFFDAQIVTRELLEMLLVAAENSSGDTQAKAKALYKSHVALFDSIIDLGDIVNTGIVSKVDNKKKNSLLKSVTKSQIENQILDEKKRPFTKEYLDICAKAADVFTANEIYSEAVKCLIVNLAHGSQNNEAAGKLSKIFAAQGNMTVSDYFSKMSAKA